MEVFGQLDQILDYAWLQLAKAPNQKRHSWRTAVVANLVGQRVLQRTVVLRKAILNKRLLRFYTDIRSTKIQPLPENDSFSWLFYDARKQIQLRLQTRAELMTGAKAQEVWQYVNPYTIKDYAANSAPGVPVEGPEANLYATDDTVLMEQAKQNFAVVDCIAYEMEFLQLHREGHRRALFRWEDTSSNWKGTWLVP